MAGIDLSTIVYRAYQKGDLGPENPPTPTNITSSPSRPINLDGIKFRAFMYGDLEQ